MGDIKLSPERLIFKTTAGTKKTFPVIIYTQGKGFEILRLDNKIENLQAEIVTIEAFRNYRINFSIAPGTPPGPIRGVVKVYTNCPGETELKIHILGNVVGNAVEVGYFFERGCLKCDQVHDYLQLIKREEGQKRRSYFLLDTSLFPYAPSQQNRYSFP